MTHEFKEIIQQTILNQQNGILNVLATVVDLEGSSYRKPGVRMLLSSNGKLTGAVSGGCVEKEIQQRAQTIFKDGKSKIITYDGRYRLGCEGVLYILLEPITISSEFIKAFLSVLSIRESFTIQSIYKKEDECYGNLGSKVKFRDKTFSFSENIISNNEKESLVFSQILQPLFRLIIIGGEHDAVKLCMQAAQLGWQVDVITSIKDSKGLSDFPGATSVIAQTPEIIELSNINDNTAIVIMNHNFTYDLRYIAKLQEQNPIYVGVLGAARRREKMLNELFDLSPEISDTFLDKIHTPAGLNIGAETPEEIALSILAEILSVVRNKEVFSLKNVRGKIHS